MRKVSFLLFACLFLLLTTANIFAQSQDVEPTEGTLEAFGKKSSRLGICPLKHTTVKAEISGFISRVRVVQEFENNFNEPIEAVYIFPLPNDAAVDDMTMRIGERVVRGRIMKREDARTIYETAKTEGKTAALLDQERPNVFTQSIANILPNEKITVEISYVATLKYEDGAYEVVFPMTVAPRYNPSTTTDASKISPPVAVKDRAGHEVSIEINLDAGVPVEEIRSVSHEIETVNQIANKATVRLKNEKTIPNKDFVLRYDVSGKRIEDALLTHRDERGGYFTLIVQPPDQPPIEDVTPKEIVFVLDTSGSMGGFPIEKAKEAMRLSLENLYPQDTFNLITFAGDTEILFDQPVPATPANLERARQFLESRSGAGGTEMMKAIKAALEPSDSQTHVRVVCFMTDGLIGNENEIIAEVQKHPNARVFSFGIGNSVNRSLLDKIAEEGRGEAEYVTLAEEGSRAAKKFYERVRTPLLTDISIDWNGLPVADVYPKFEKRRLDLFSAKPIVVFGRYTKGASGTIRLRGKVAGQDYVREIPVNFPESIAANDSLATLWARTRINELTSQDYKGEQKEIQEAITNVGLEYHLLTQYTSFVAVEERVVAQPNGQPKKIEVPVNLPEGMTTADREQDSPFKRMEVIANLQSPPKVETKKVYKNWNKNSVGYIVSSGSGRGSGTGGGVGNGGTMKVAKTISAGVLNGKATVLPKPAYPAAAKAVRATGVVNVQVTIDESGNVVSANAVSGHPLLRQVSIAAARQAKFAPTLISGKPVKTSGIIAFNFSMPTNAAPSVTTAVRQISLQQAEETNSLPVSETLTPEMKRRKAIDEKFHIWLADLAKRLLNGGGAAPTSPNEAKFMRDGKAEIQIRLAAERTPEIIERLKNLGFEPVSEKDKKTLVGRISLDKLLALAEAEQVRYVLPSLK